MAGGKVWLITGCSSGLGLHLARVVLSQGHKVIASSRNPLKTPKLVQEIKNNGGHWITLDVTSQDVKQPITEAIAIYGYLDFVVNNAGFSVIGGFEDLRESDIYKQFDTNVIGVFKVMQAVLPGMRVQRSGTIINISSIGGFRTAPALSLYSASKHALEGLSEGVSKEYAEFGVRVLLIEPGPFRTDILHKNTYLDLPLSDFYRGTVIEKTLDYIRKSNGKQPGDPDKAAQRIYEVAMGVGMAKGRKEYLRLVLGKIGLEQARAKVKLLKETFDTLEDISESVDFA